MYLLVWMCVPEDHSLYEFHETSENNVMLTGAHDTFINLGNENEHTNKLNLVLENKEPLSNDTPANGPYNKVFVSGFIL